MMILLYTSLRDAFSALASQVAGIPTAEHSSNQQLEHGFVTVLLHIIFAEVNLGHSLDMEITNVQHVSRDDFVVSFESTFFKTKFHSNVRTERVHYSQ